MGALVEAEARRFSVPPEVDTMAAPMLTEGLVAGVGVAGAGVEAFMMFRYLVIT